MEPGPLVSVIVPVYDGERYLGEAIQSVLDQSYRPVELIVADDGSSDGSAAVARLFGARLRLTAEPHRGQAAALNRGVELARGRFLAFLDADDLWPSDKLAAQMRAMIAPDPPDLVLGFMRCFHSPELDEAARARFPLPPDRPGLVRGAMLIDGGAFARVGPFDTRWRLGEFIDWHARAVECGLRQLVLPEVVLRRRVHARNLTVRERDAQGDFVRIAKAALDRRRALGKR